MIKAISLQSLIVVLLLLQACSGNGFQLRKTQDLPKKYRQIQVVNVPDENGFTNAFQIAIEESGGRLAEKAETKININNFREGKRVVAYDKDRKARIYLLFLKFEYQISDEKNNLKLQQHRINLDRTFVYDANFALGKAEEENQIRHELYTEASRLILLRLKHSEK